MTNPEALTTATGYTLDELSTDAENVLRTAVGTGADLAPILARTFRGLDGLVYLRESA